MIKLRTVQSHTHVFSTGTPLRRNAPMHMWLRVYLGLWLPALLRPCTLWCTPHLSLLRLMGMWRGPQDSLLRTSARRGWVVLSGLQRQETCCSSGAQLPLWKGSQPAASPVAARDLKTTGTSTEGKPARRGGWLPEEEAGGRRMALPAGAGPARLPLSLPRRQRQQS